LMSSAAASFFPSVLSSSIGDLLKRAVLDAEPRSFHSPEEVIPLLRPPSSMVRPTQRLSPFPPEIPSPHNRHSFLAALTHHSSERISFPTVFFRPRFNLGVECDFLHCVAVFRSAGAKAAFLSFLLSLGLAFFDFRRVAAFPGRHSLHSPWPRVPLRRCKSTLLNPSRSTRLKS